MDRLRRCHHRRDVLALRSQFLAAPFPRVLIEPFRLGLTLPFRCFPLFLLKLHAGDDLRLRCRGRRVSQQIAVLDDHRDHPLRLTQRDLAGGDCGDQGYRGVDDIRACAHLRQIERDPVAMLRGGAIEEEAHRCDIAFERAVDLRLHDRLDLLLDQRFGDKRGLVARAPGPARGIARPAGRERPAGLNFRRFCKHALCLQRRTSGFGQEHSMNKNPMQALTRFGWAAFARHDIPTMSCNASPLQKETLRLPSLSGRSLGVGARRSRACRASGKTAPEPASSRPVRLTHPLSFPEREGRKKNRLSVAEADHILRRTEKAQ